MKTRALATLGIMAAVALWAWLGQQLHQSDQEATPQAAATRVVCLDPGITEVILRLGAGHKLVARPDHTQEFAEIAALPTAGTGITPNYEAIARARPDLILLSGGAGSTFTDLQALAPTRALPWLTVADVTAGIRSVAKRLGQAEQGESLASEVENGLADNLSPESPRVLLLIGAPNEARPDLWYIKDDSLHGAALRAAGGRNALPGERPGPPSLPLERLLELDPDRIIMLISDPQTSETHLEEHRRFWDRLSQLRAVRNNGIHFLVGAENFRTGPGILKLVTTLRRALQSPTEERP